MSKQEIFETIQKVAEATNGIVTPGNATSATGFGLSMHGISNLDGYGGLIETGAGFGLDVVDGKVSRATGTASPLGEVVDATLDKIKTGYFAAKLLLERRAPKGLVAAVIGQNALNAGITLYDKRVNDPPRVHPTKAGKYGMFAQNSGLFLHAIGTKIREKRPVAGKTIKLAGSVIGYTGVGISLVASKQYAGAAGIIN